MEYHHDSLAQSSMSPRMKSLRKRLWWIIYVRKSTIAEAMISNVSRLGTDMYLGPLADLVALEMRTVILKLLLKKIFILILPSINTSFQSRKTIMSHMYWK